MKEESKVECTIGTDPEYFVKKDEEYVAAQNAKIPGTKHEPHQLKSGGTVQRDNVAVEFATVPARSGAEFVDRIKDCIVETVDMIPKDHEIVVEPSAVFNEDQLEDPETQEFGCDPDFNAYTVTENEKPWCGDSGFRSCGAHIHVGCFDDKGKVIAGLEFLLDFDGRLRAVKAMDLFHGIISTLLDNSEAAIKRRELYGQAGCHRPTDYGVEYRVLSNYWMKSPELVMLMDALTRDAMALVSADKLEPILAEVGEDDLQNVINEGQVEAAVKIIENYVKPNLRGETLELLDMCQANLPNYKSIAEEWGI